MSPIISLQVSEDLHERFEKVRTFAGFNSKSEALRDAIVNFIEIHEEFENIEGYKIMNLNLVYPFKEIVIDRVSEIYTEFNNVIRNVSDWRIAGKKIEIVLAVGEFGLIRDLYDKLAKIKHVMVSIHEIILE
ncbi:MAG: hypothetical protein ACOC44_16225 [Promethearchaeia archaeon]